MVTSKVLLLTIGALLIIVGLVILILSLIVSIKTFSKLHNLSIVKTVIALFVLPLSILLIIGIFTAIIFALAF
jgi:hypothetical protein